MDISFFKSVSYLVYSTYAVRVMGKLKPIKADLGREAGFILDKAGLIFTYILGTVNISYIHLCHIWA